MEDRPQFTILAGKQSDGVTYQLHPATLKQLHDLFPHVTQAPSVFVGYETKSDFERVHGAMWNQIVTMLTGVGLERLKPHGSVQVHIVNTDETFDIGA